MNKSIKLINISKNKQSSNTKDKTALNSSDIGSSFIAKLNSPLKNTKDILIQDLHLNKPIKNQHKFSLFNMNEKERKQFQRDLYSPIFELTETYKLMAKAKSLKNIENSRNDFYKLIKGKTETKPHIQILSQSYASSCLPETNKNKQSSN